MKKFIFLFLALGVLSVLGFLWWYSVSGAPSLDRTERAFVVTRGLSAEGIGEKLAKEGFIKSSLAFKVYTQVLGKSLKIQAGEYSLDYSYSLTAIVRELLKGPTEIWVTVPEGLRREQVAQKFIESFNLSGEKGEDFREEFLQVTKDKEGFLFPDTYLFPKTATASGVIKRMVQVFDQQVDEKMREDIKSSGLTLEEVVTLASIIERETRSADERPDVAGVLLKRLQAGWPLQTDAANQYAIASVRCKNSLSDCTWWPNLTREDLEINSLYNTYKYRGLPPGPIASPGLTAIKGVIYAKDNPYWFYLHDTKGTIHFAKTLEEHNENIRIYLGK